MRDMLVSSDPILKRRQRFHYDGHSGEYAFSQEYDVSDIVDTNKALYAGTDERTRHGDVERYASIPLHILFQWQAEWDEKGFGDAERELDLRRKLDDPDLRSFRTRPGRLFRPGMSARGMTIAPMGSF